jgi:hypothetical protein
MPIGDQQYDVSAAEMDRMKRRAEIRTKLQAEFNRMTYNPYRMVHRIEMLDPAVQRFMAAHVARFDYWKPDWKSFWIYLGTHFVPIALFAWVLGNDKTQFERKCRTGEISYHDREFKFGFTGSSIW